MRAFWLHAAAFLLLAGVAVAGTQPDPLQRGSSQGVRVSVFAPAHVVFDLSRANRHVRHVLGGPQIMPGCLKARLVAGQWRYTEVSGPTTRFARRLVLNLSPTLLPPVRRQRQAGPRRVRFRAPYDGCEIGGLYGHRWNDAFGTRAAVEIWLTASGRHFFNDRAAARDLAYFVRAGRGQRQIRLSSTPELGLGWYVHRYPGRVIELKSPGVTVAKDVIGVWIGARTIVFTATSSTGRRFFVVAERGTYKLPRKNLGDLALVF
jgi:hypothetical protein